jgi:hypothetical protein
LSAKCLQMTAAAFGVSSLVAISANFVVWIKWLGVIYLLWLGLKLILRRDPLDIVQAAPVKSAWHLYQQGGLTSLGNPFAVMFLQRCFRSLSTRRPLFYRSLSFWRHLSSHRRSDYDFVGRDRFERNLWAASRAGAFGCQALWRVDNRCGHSAWD